MFDGNAPMDHNNSSAVKISASSRQNLSNKNYYSTTFSTLPTQKMAMTKKTIDHQRSIHRTKKQEMFQFIPKSILCQENFELYKKLGNLEGNEDKFIYD
jgi:hypothetical protein